jgi:hypothetical protein
MHSPRRRRRRPPTPRQPTSMPSHCLGTGKTSQTFYQVTVWSVHLVATTGHPEGRRSINGNSRRVMTQMCPTRTVLRYIPWYLPEVLDIDGTNFIAQVAQICYSPVTCTPSNFISITGYHKPDSVYHFRGHKLFTWPSLSCISNSSVRFQLQVSLSCLF